MQLSLSILDFSVILYDFPKFSVQRNETRDLDAINRIYQGLANKFLKTQSIVRAKPAFLGARSARLQERGLKCETPEDQGLTCNFRETQ